SLGAESIGKTTSISSRRFSPGRPSTRTPNNSVCCLGESQSYSENSAWIDTHLRRGCLHGSLSFPSLKNWPSYKVTVMLTDIAAPRNLFSAGQDGWCSSLPTGD